MLNLGDVSIYATCSYLIGQLRAQGYATARVAGVPSFCAAAALLDESLTDIDTPLHIIPSCQQQDLEAALALPGTKVLMKSAAVCPRCCTLCRTGGWRAPAPWWPTAACRASWPCPRWKGCLRRL